MNTNAYILAADVIERRLEFAHLPHGWWAVGGIVLLAAMLAVVIFIYRREQRSGASARARLFLAGVRCAVILVLALIWLEPILATYINRTIESSTLVLVDGSASMSLADRYPNPEDARRVAQALSGDVRLDVTRRAQLLEKVLLADDPGLLARLAANNPVQLYQFGNHLTALGQVDTTGGLTPSSGKPATQPAASDAGPDRSAVPAAIAQAAAPATDIGRAIRQAVESQSGSPVAAIVVFSDGRFNQGEPPEVVARYAQSRKIPIYAVGVGDPSPPRNVAVSAIEAPTNVFVKDPFKVTAYLRAQGIAGASVKVELLERRTGSGRDGAQSPVVVDSKQVAVDAQGRLEPVVFNRQIADAAEVSIAVRVVPVDGETLTNDNEKQITVRALDNKMRVLLVSGGPTWEYRYLSRLLERDATISVSCWLQSADEESVRDGNVVIDHFPRAREEVHQYDCIILMDPQAMDIDPAWAAHVESMVGTFGGGLLYVAGRKNAPHFAHDPNTQALLSLLPVVFDQRSADLVLNDLGHFQPTAWPFTIEPSAVGSPVLALSDKPEENAQIWSRLTGVYWHYPVRREKPVAQVLLRHSNPRMRTTEGEHVLLATQYFGSGRTAYMAFDSTWRWRRYGDRYFNRFWIQLVRHLVEGKLLSGQKRGLLQFERDQYSVGEPVTVQARLADARYGPLTQDTVQAALTIEGKAHGSVSLKAEPNRLGWYRGQFMATEVGTHGLQIDLEGGEGTPPATIRGEVRVGQTDLEFRQTELDRAALEALAAGSAGGRYLEIDEADQLTTLIPSKRAQLVLTGQPMTLWDRWWTFVILVGLLGVEWTVRKRVHLL